MVLNRLGLASAVASVALALVGADEMWALSLLGLALSLTLIARYGMAIRTRHEHHLTISIRLSLCFGFWVIACGLVFEDLNLTPFFLIPAVLMELVVAILRRNNGRPNDEELDREPEAIYDGGKNPASRS